MTTHMYMTCRERAMTAATHETAITRRERRRQAGAVVTAVSIHPYTSPAYH